MHVSPNLNMPIPDFTDRPDARNYSQSLDILDEFAGQVNSTQPTEEIAVVTHNHGMFPSFSLYAGEQAHGFGGYGEGGYGGSSIVSLPAKFEILSSNAVKIYTVPQYAGSPTVSKLTDMVYALIYPGTLQSLTLIMR